jgi:hypothetical protein
MTDDKSGKRLATLPDALASLRPDLRRSLSFHHQ